MKNALFFDDFKSAKLEGWRPDRPDVWRVEKGMLRADLPDAKQEHSLIYAGDSTWTDYALEFDVCGMRGVDKGAVVRVRGNSGLGIDLRGPGYQDLRINLGQIPLGKATVQNGNAVWHHVRFEVQDNRCRITVNGDRVFDRKLSFKLAPGGGIAFAAYTGGIGECTVFYDNVVVTALK